MPVQVIIHANDSLDHTHVTGNVVVETTAGPKVIGNKFEPAYNGDVDIDKYPKVYVVAQGFEDIQAPIKFTGPLPHIQIQLPPCLRPRGNC
jgi:hypothetical protein